MAWCLKPKSALLKIYRNPNQWHTAFSPKGKHIIWNNVRCYLLLCVCFFWFEKRIHFHEIKICFYANSHTFWYSILFRSFTEYNLLWKRYDFAFQQIEKCKKIQILSKIKSERASSEQVREMRLKKRRESVRCALLFLNRKLL